MAVPRSNVVELRHRNWSASGRSSAKAGATAYQPYAGGMLALAEQLACRDQAILDENRDLRELQDDLARFRDLFERAPVGFLVLSLGGEIQRANRTAAALLQSAQSSVEGRYLREFCADGSQEQLGVHLQQLSGGKRFDVCEIALQRQSQQPLPARLETLNVGDGFEGPLRAILLDSSALRELEDGLILAASVIEHSSQPILVTDSEQRVISINPAFATATGYTAGEILGQSAMPFLSDGSDPSLFVRMLNHLREHGYWQGKVSNQRRSGHPYTAWASINEVRDAAGEPKYHVCMLSDLTSEEGSRRELLQLAYFDSLTGLANRASLFDQIDKALLQARRDKHPLGIIYLDLDHFKAINDSLGHSAGDRLLQFAANTLRGAVRPADSVARLGGDEFAIIVPSLPGEGAAGQIAANILDRFRTTPFREQGRDIYVSTSVGITLFPKDGTDSEVLLNCADSAMYQAKHAGGGTYRFYSTLTSPDFQRREALESDLRRALGGRELHVSYQPQVRLTDFQIVGCEALLNWRSNGRGLVDPGLFIPLAEKTEVIIPFQHWLINAAAAQAPRWVPTGNSKLRLVFHPSTLHLGTAHVEQLIGLMRRAVEESVCPLELEFPQSSLMNCPAQVLKAMQRLRDLGVILTLGGFGAGLCSLPQFAKLPVTRVKIEASLIQGLESDPGSMAAVQGAIALGKTFGLVVLADGVETPGQLRFLRDHGCDEGQGPLFSSPVTGTVLGELLEQCCLTPVADLSPNSGADLPAQTWLARITSKVFQRLRGRSGA